MSKERQTVSPLRRALTSLTADELIKLLESVGVQWTLSHRKQGDLYAAIYAEGAVKYQATSSNESAVAVLANVAARFFANEQNDYHNYKEQP